MKKNKIIFVVISFVVAAFGLYLYIYKDHRDIASENESYLVKATSIYDEFKKDETKSNLKYLDKTIEVSGKVSSIDLTANIIVLDDKLGAVFKDKIPGNIEKLSDIKIKGRFIGYDDLLEELKMDQCDLVTD
jgi:uncharacterized protein YxeA